MMESLAVNTGEGRTVERVDKRGVGNDGGDADGDPPVSFSYSVSSFLFFCFGFFFFKQSLSFLTNAQSLGL